MSEPRLSKHILHRRLELVEIHLIMTIFDRTWNNLVPDLLIEAMGSEQLLEVTERENSVLVGIDDLECFATLIIFIECFPVDTG